MNFLYLIFWIILSAFKKTPSRKKIAIKKQLYSSKRKKPSKISKNDHKPGDICPKVMWLMGHRLNDDLQHWVKKNVDFLDKDEKKKFELEKTYPDSDLPDISEEIKKYDIEMVANNYGHWTQLSFNDMKKKLLTSQCEEKGFNFCTHIVRQMNFTYPLSELRKMRRLTKAKFYAEEKEDQLNLETNNFQKFEFTARYKRQIKVIQNLEGVVKDQKQLKDTLEMYQFPIYFYDFETSPFEHIPFQYSIHVLINKNYDLKTGKNIAHYEFIAPDRNDPKKAFLQKFTLHIQIHGPGTYTAYNISFEKTILKNLLKKIKTSKKNHTVITNVISKTVDLMDFYKNLNIYHRDFHGCLTLKNTLSVFFPKLSYQNLTVQKGFQASSIYFGKPITETDRKDLLEYCARDTWAIVLLYDKFKQFWHDFKK